MNNLKIAPHNYLPSPTEVAELIYIQQASLRFYRINFGQGRLGRGQGYAAPGPGSATGTGEGPGFV